MASIAVSDARALFTKQLVMRYKESVLPTNFLRSFFREEERSSLEISIEVKRTTERVAVDIFRGAEGNRNNIRRFTEKIFIPPYYREYMDLTDIRGYDLLFGQMEGTISDQTFGDIMTQAREDMDEIQEKIERAYELQASQVFHTGILTLNAGTNVNFRRKAGSIADLGAGNYWNEASVNPITNFVTAGNFIRQEGKAQGGIFNAIVGEDALQALLSNPNFIARADLRRVALDDVNMPVRISESVGSVFHGTISAGSYKFNIWTYAEFYEDRANSNALTPYVESNVVIVLPMEPNFVLAYAAVPKITRDLRNAEYPEFISNVQGKFVMGNYLDQRKESHIFDVKSAGIAIPVSIDKIYTMQVLADS